MIKFLLQAIFGVLLKALQGWWQRHKAERDNATTTANRDAALADAQRQRDHAAVAVEESHAQTDAAVDRVRADDSLRDQSDDVQRAIDAANRGVRGA